MNTFSSEKFAGEDSSDCYFAVIDLSVGIMEVLQPIPQSFLIIIRSKHTLLLMSELLKLMTKTILVFSSRWTQFRLTLNIRNLLLEAKTIEAYIFGRLL